VFGKIELERMPIRKVWDYAINLKEIFKPWKDIQAIEGKNLPSIQK